MRKVLLVCFDNLGDLVFTSALAAALSSDPQSELSVWCKDYTSSVARLMPGVKQVFASDPFWDSAPGRPKGSFWNFVLVLRRVRRERFVLAILPSTSWKAALALLLAGIPKRVAWKGKKNSLFLSAVTPKPRRDEPVIAALAKSFAPFLPRPAESRSCLEKQRLPSWTEPLPPKPLALIHAFAGRLDRCADPQLLWRFAQYLESQAYHVLWVGTDHELKQLAKALPELPKSAYADAARYDLLPLAALIEKSQLFIGHDSGPLHVATALGIPVLGMYLPGQPERAFPQGRGPSIYIVKSRPAELSFDDLSQALIQLTRDAPISMRYG
ncbi:MAG TPA: glycosyltransferase family 9 protein [Oligoflexus sp.]|uniref:glycosyltransferase family 9 protein n=1 Tax=Oligoflexus sp. TaxID=1971216 RepID=UPI002D7F4ACE|nr:glycosyltransferase family 9 protein [Oligoflexus sp.]HET9236345.1 glycosyltransferase family 9 protein [Oligoflexus sp.]